MMIRVIKHFNFKIKNGHDVHRKLFKVSFLLANIIYKSTNGIYVFLRELIKLQALSN